MPTFPTYQRTLPKSLSLFKPAHYLLLLAYWVYFRPSALIRYFYQAMPELFDSEKPIGFFENGAHRYFKLFLMIPFVCTLITLVLGGVMAEISAPGV